MNIIKYLLDICYRQFNEPPKILSIDATIDLILSKNLSVARFGDGEFDILLRSNDIGFQKMDNELGKKLCDTLNSNDKNLLVCIPGVFTSKDLKRMHYKARRCWVRFLYKKRKALYNIIDFEKMFGDTQFTRNYIDLADKTNSLEYFNKIKLLWENRDVVVIEGKYTRFGVGNNLLNNAKSIKRILCPPTNAFDKYGEILDVAKKKDNNVLFLIALGPTATVLAADLSAASFQAIDIGHLDIEYEWFLAGVEEKVSVCNKWVNETKGIMNNETDTLHDKGYEAQIVDEIL